MKKKLAFVYSCSNKHQLRKWTSVIKKHRMKYTIYDEYIMTAKQLPLRSASDYYIKFVGKAPVKKFKNNEIECEDIINKKIESHGCVFKRRKRCYELQFPNEKKIYFKRQSKDDWLFDKIFVVTAPEYFELNYNEQNRLEDVDENYLDAQHNVSMQLEEEQEEVEEKILDFKECEDMAIMKNFDITRFLKYLTRNQAIIIVLTLLNIGGKAIATLMGNSPAYITLETERIIRKLRKKIEERKL